MTTRIRVTNEEPAHGHTVRVATTDRAGATEFETRDLKPGQSETFHLHGGNRLSVYELDAPAHPDRPPKDPPRVPGHHPYG